MKPDSPLPPADVRHAGDRTYVDALPGVQRKTMVHGPHTLLAEFLLAKAAVIPLHQHPQEQTGYLVSGRAVFTIAGIEHEVRPGDSWMIPGGVEHGVRVLEDSVVVEIFSPVRTDYLP